MFKEIKEELIHISYTPDILRSFGLVGSIILLIFALVTGKSLLFFLGIFIALAALFSPRLLAFVYHPLTFLTIPIGWFVSRGILLAVYIAVFVPTNLLLRLAGKDILKLKIDKNLPTYWEDSPQKIDYEKMF